jgi:bacillopeptidase F (M6 metalloprotease family)
MKINWKYWLTMIALTVLIETCSGYISVSLSKLKSSEMAFMMSDDKPIDRIERVGTKLINFVRGV